MLTFNCILPVNRQGNETVFKAYSQSKMLQDKDGQKDSKETQAYISEKNKM